MNDATIRARAILDEVQGETRRRLEQNGLERLSPKDESELRKWRITRYTEAIQLDPTLAEAYAERGSDLYFERRRSEAQADMRKAFTLRPNDAVVYGSMSSPFEGDEKREILQVGMSLAEPSSDEYAQLREMFIRSYWYDGDFTQFVHLLEEWLPQLDPTSYLHPHALQDLAMGYSALGDYDRAETTYRQALPVTHGIMRASVAEMIIRTRMHRGAYDMARAAVRELRSELSPDKGTTFDAALLVLASPAAVETQEAATAALPVAEPLGKAPGPLGNSTSYYAFLLGLIYEGAARHHDAMELLRRFADEFAANKREWAITLRWEIATARETAAGLAKRYGSAS